MKVLEQYPNAKIYRLSSRRKREWTEVHSLNGIAIWERVHHNSSNKVICVVPLSRELEWKAFLDGRLQYNDWDEWVTLDPKKASHCPLFSDGEVYHIIPTKVEYTLCSKDQEVTLQVAGLKLTAKLTAEVTSVTPPSRSVKKD